VSIYEVYGSGEIMINKSENETIFNIFLLSFSIENLGWTFLRIKGLNVDPRNK
jgi:hypothetical protein